MFDIILRHWFLVDRSFQLPESENENENEDNFSTKLNHDMKHKRSIPSLQGVFIDLDNLPQMQQEVGQLN
jgi:hypothetical protein